MLLANRLQFGVILRGGDSEVDEGSAAVGAGVFGQCDAIRFGIDLFEVVDEFVVMEMPIGELRAEGLFGSGDSGVGVSIAREVVVEGGYFDGGGGKGEGEEKGQRAHGGSRDGEIMRDKEGFLPDLFFWEAETKGGPLAHIIARKPCAGAAVHSKMTPFL